MHLLASYPNEMHVLFLAVLWFLIEFPMLFLVSWEEMIAALLEWLDLPRETIIMMCAAGFGDFKSNFALQKDKTIC